MENYQYGAGHIFATVDSSQNFIYVQSHEPIRQKVRIGNCPGVSRYSLLDK